MRIDVSGTVASFPSSVCDLGFQRWKTWQHAANALALTIDVDACPPTVEVAIERLLAQACIAIDGTCIDVETARAVVRFAASLQAVILQSTGNPAFAHTAERLGYVGATLSEVALRADSLVLLGHPFEDYPRLQPWLADVRNANRLEPQRLYAFNASGKKEALQDNAVELAMVRLALEQQNPSLHPLADWLQDGQYIAWLWSATAIDLSSAANLIGVNDALNEDRRSVLVPISEQATLRSVCSWLTGLAPPIEFYQGLPRSFQQETSLVPQVRIWLQPFPDSPSPPDDGAFTILIGLVDPTQAFRADLYLRARSPGIEAAGLTYRGDGTVCLPLSQVVPDNDLYLPTASMVLASLLRHVHARKEVQ